MKFIHLGDQSRLDLALIKLMPDWSRTFAQKLIKSQKVMVNQSIITSSKFLIQDQDEIDIEIIEDSNREDEAQFIAIDVAYEDDFIVVINKPPGLTVHPGAGQADQTLLNAILYQYPENRSLPQAGMVHRLDKDTSGLLMIAKDLATHTKLSNLLQKRQIKKTYLALVNGRVHQPGTVNEPLARHQTNRQKFAVHPYGRPSVTHYEIHERFTHHTLLRIDLETGRTHQIRVHMEYVNHPLVGDQKYGSKKTLKANMLTALQKDAIGIFKRQALHAYELEFEHPHTKEPIKIKCPIPADLKDLLTALRS